MQDGTDKPGDEAGQWLREHFADDPHPKIDITWTVREEPDPAGFARLLAALFTPPDDGPTP